MVCTNSQGSNISPFLPPIFNLKDRISAGEHFYFNLGNRVEREGKSEEEK